MSDTLYPDPTTGFVPPQVMGLLGMAGGLAQAAMPSRLPVPTGAALGMGAQGLMQGAMQQRQLQAADMQNQTAALNNRLVAGRLALATGSMGGGGPGFGSLAGPGMSNVQGGGSAPGPGPSGGASPITSAQHEMDLANQYAAYGLGGVAVEHLKIAQGIIGGPGFTGLSDGSSTYVRGAGQDPAVKYRDAAATAGGGLAAKLAEQGMMLGPGGNIIPLPGFAGAKAQTAGAVAQAGVQPAIDQATGIANADARVKQVTYTAVDPQSGLLREYTTTADQLPSLTGSGAASGGASPSPASGAMSGQVWAGRIVKAESGGNANASNPGSTAAGPAGFTDGTWNAFMQARHPELMQGQSPQAVASLKSNPQLAQEGTLWNAQQNASVFAQNDLTPNAYTLALAHRLGAQGAADVLRAPANAPISSIPSMQGALGVNGQSGQAINPDLQGKTAGQVRANYLLKFGRSPVDLSSVAPAAGGPSGAPQGIPGAPVMTEEQKALSTAYGARAGQIVSDASSAQANAPKLQILANAQSMFTPGASSDARLQGSRMLVDAIRQFGGTPPQWLVNGATGGEVIQKEGMSLATAVAKGMGREPGFIVSMIAKNLPNTKLTDGGFTAVLQGLAQEGQRKQDLAQFQDQWLGSGHSSIAGMESAFNQAHPPEAYASRVVPFPLPKSAGPTSASGLIPNVVYRTARGPGIWNGQQFVAVGS